jgi:hypothetical protein
MNFLNPLFLFALGAVAIPLLIHIFSKRRVPEVPFSTLRFLKRSDRRSMRWINLRRLLLLLLRMAAITLLALAFARPVLRGGVAALFPAESPRAVCILVDRSFSMGVEESGGSLFERAKTKLGEILEGLEREDEVSIVLFDRAGEVVYGGTRFDREAAIGTARNMEPSWEGTDLRSAVNAAGGILAASRREAKELFIISDFQKAGLEPGAEASTQVTARAFIVPVQAETESNAAIERVLTPRVALHAGELAEINVLMKNWSRSLNARFPLEVLIDGQRIIEREIEIPPGGMREERLAFPVERAGWLEGEVRKKADRLSADDRRFFALDVSEKVNVLLIAGTGGYYLEQALEPEGAEGDISLVSRNWRNFTTADLEDADAVVMGPGRGPLEKDLAILQRFITDGGTALVLALPELENAVRTFSVFSAGIDFIRMGSGFASIELPPTRPPFLAPFDDKDLQALSRLRLRRFAAVRGIPAHATILGLSSGDPLIWKERYGGGTIVFASIDPSPEAGDLVLSPYFLPVIQQAILAAGPEQSPAEGNLVGEPLVWTGSFRIQALCRLPGGEEVKPVLSPGRAAGRGGADDRFQTILIPPAREPGFVRVYDGSDLAGLIPVNPDSRTESDLETVPATEAADSLGLHDATLLGSGREMSAGIHAAREGREISGILIIAVLALFAAELVVAQREKGTGSV